MTSRRTLVVYGLGSSVATAVALWLFILFIQLQFQFDTFSPFPLVGSVLAGTVAFVVFAEGLAEALKSS